MRLPLFVFLAATAAAVPLLAQAPAPNAAPAPAPMSPFQTVRERVSYGVGHAVGENLRIDGYDIDLELFMRGLSEALKGQKSVQNEEAFREAMRAFAQEKEQKRLTENQAFLAANSKKEGVKTTPSGLQYQVLRPGAGKRPTANDSVKAHYHGTFVDGNVFDSSYEREEPAIFPLNGVIKGWTEGVPLMQVGAKYRFWIPSDLAYGPRGRPGIPPNSLLIFDVELLDVLPAEAPGELPPKK